ncbi:GNAT family N-acetyltransferase [Streptomyces longisporus]|uniref:BioF2-like acetyltransferase domain-containing protein n=1 Tax=Streptomyces longisporus TaxID=1948 RepID=A0ABN3NFC6_STRLO
MVRGQDGDRSRLYLAEYDGEVLSAALMINVGSRAWHSYAASGRRGRELRPSSSLLWRMLCDARAAGVTTDDLRSVAPVLTGNRLLNRLRFTDGRGRPGGGVPRRVEAPGGQPGQGAAAGAGGVSRRR